MFAGDSGNSSNEGGGIRGPVEGAVFARFALDVQQMDLGADRLRPRQLRE